MVSTIHRPFKSYCVPLMTNPTASKELFWHLIFLECTGCFKLRVMREMERSAGTDKLCLKPKIKSLLKPYVIHGG